MLKNHTPGFIRELCGWFNLAEYKAAKEHATELVISRFGRGNISVQNGYILDDAGLKAQSLEGDAAFTRLSKRVKKHS